MEQIRIARPMRAAFALVLAVLSPADVVRSLLRAFSGTRLRALRAAHSGERGAVIVMFAGAMTAMMGMAALTIDVGSYYVLRIQVQNAADAAAHAAALQLPDLGLAEAAATDYWALNAPSIGTQDPAIITYPTPGSVRVQLTGTVQFSFARILGIDSGSTSVAATVSRDSVVADVVLAVDRSGSMCLDSYGSLTANCPDSGPWEPFDSVIEAALVFPDAVLTHTEDRLGLISYSTDAVRDMPMSQGWPSYETQLGQLAPDGLTNIAAAIDLSVETLFAGAGGGNGNLKFIVLISDGVPSVDASGNYCGPDCDEAKELGRQAAIAARAQGVVIYTIGLGDAIDPDYMTELAELTSGRYVDSPTPEDLTAAFASVSRLARLRFTE